MQKAIVTTSIISVTLAALVSKAQNSDTLRMNLAECVEFALKNNNNLKNATLDEEIAKAKVREIRGIGLPQINGSVGLQHYFKLRNLYFPGSAPFAPRDPNGQPFFPNAAQIVNENFFQLPTAIDANVTASQLLFSASYIVGLQAAKTYEELTRKSAQQSREQIAANVKKAYFQQLVNAERLKLFDINLIRLDSTLRQMKTMQKNGFVEQLEVDRLEVNYNNLLTEYEKTLNLWMLSALLLKFQMGMPLEQNLLLKEDLSTFIADTSFVVPENVNPKNRTEYQLLQLQLRANKLDLKNNQCAILPSLVASGTLGYFTSNNDINLFQKRQIVTPDGVFDQNLYWSDYSFIQIGLNVPIFGGGINAYRAQQSRLNVKKSENNLKSFEESANLQIQTALVNLKNSERSMKMQKRNMDLAKNVNDITYKKYKNGVASNLELTASEAALKEAQINYFNVLYEFLISKIEYEQAAGLNKY